MGISTTPFSAWIMTKQSISSLLTAKLCIPGTERLLNSIEDGTRHVSSMPRWKIAISSKLRTTTYHTSRYQRKAVVTQTIIFHNPFHT
jgi:hypothetical protein